MFKTMFGFVQSAELQTLKEVCCAKIADINELWKNVVSLLHIFPIPHGKISSKKIKKLTEIPIINAGETFFRGIT